MLGDAELRMEPIYSRRSAKPPSVFALFRFRLFLMRACLEFDTTCTYFLVATVFSELPLRILQNICRMYAYL